MISLFKFVRTKYPSAKQGSAGRDGPQQILNFHGTPEDEDVLDGDRDGDEDVRGRQFLRVL